MQTKNCRAKANQRFGVGYLLPLRRRRKPMPPVTHTAITRPMLPGSGTDCRLPNKPCCSPSWPRREIQLTGAAAPPIVARRQSPQTINRDRVVRLILQLAQKRIPRLIEDVDASVPEVALPADRPHTPQRLQAQWQVPTAQSSAPCEPTRPRKLPLVSKVSTKPLPAPAISSCLFVSCLA